MLALSCGASSVPPAGQQQQQPDLGRQVAGQLGFRLGEGIALDGHPQSVQRQRVSRLAGPILVQAVDDDNGNLTADDEEGFARAVVRSQHAGECTSNIAVVNVEHGGVGLTGRRETPIPFGKIGGIAVGHDGNGQ